MSESYPWFKFNVTKWMLGRIQRLSFAHQGAFIRLICLYWDKDGQISLEDAELDCTPELFADLLKYKIVKSDKGFVQIDFMDELLSEKGDTSNQKRQAALERWRLEREKKRIASELQTDADAMHVHKDAMQIREEEIREEKKREEGIGVVSKETPRTQSKFVKPTIEQTTEYFLEKKWGCSKKFDEKEQAEKFMDYYTANGWKVGKNSMKDWRAAIRNWIKNIKDNGKQVTDYGQLKADSVERMAAIIRNRNNSGDS